MSRLRQLWARNRTLWITLLVMLLLFTAAIRGMETKDWVITLLRGLSVGAITFLVASGFSLIFGLMDVLNMAHGTFFMIGAYVGWTVVVRPDTFIDLLPPILIVAGGIALTPIWKQVLAGINPGPASKRIGPWLALLAGAALLVVGLMRYPITKWDPGVYANSPVTNSFEASQGILALPAPVGFAPGVSPFLVISAILAGGLFFGAGIAFFSASREPGSGGGSKPERKLPAGGLALAVLLLAAGLTVFLFNDPITAFVFGLNRTWLFVMAGFVTLLTGILLGSMMEITLIRPLYERTIYQIMLTLGLSAIGVELVRAIWGLQEFTMPRPSIFDGTGEGCPATSLVDLVRYQCSTVSVLGGRVRTYNEIFIPLLGIAVLIIVWLLLQRTKLGMIVRAGVQDSEMVEALGINVRQVFTLVFALGVGLASLGGLIGAPSTGLTTNLGISLLLNVLIALAIGGLTSYPGAALGSLIVGLLQQFIIKYGQLGIKLPFLAEPFKPTPPLVPATTVLLMVVILLIMPNGLLGRRE
jgi:branched-chain amino acid transport system permease protein